MAKKMEINSADGTNVPALVISPGKAPVVTGNFDEIRAYLEAVRDKYKKVKFTAAHMEDVQRIKKEMQVYRTSLEKIEKTVKSDYFNTPKTVFSGAMSSLFALVSEVEKKADAVLAEEDQKRIDDINLAIDAYLAKLVAETALVDKYVNKIERKEKYYNKSQKESDTLADLTVQVQELARAQKAEAANIRLIGKACAQNKLLNVAKYMAALEDGDDIATILEEIDAENLRLTQVQAGNTSSAPEAFEVEAEVVDDNSGGDEMVSEVSKVNLESDLPNRTKTLTVEITYPVDCGDSLSKVFEILDKFNVKSRVVG